MSELVVPAGGAVSLGWRKLVPEIVTQEGERAALRYVEFFTANIRNPNTRRAYARSATEFFAWCERMDLALAAIQPVHVAAWVEQRGRDGLTPPTIKQGLAAVRMLFDWLVVGQVVPHNPASAVRGPRYSTARGKTQMPTREEGRALLAGIDTSTVIGLRDRAVVGVLLYTFARVEAAAGMRVEDFYPVGPHWWVRLHEKGGKEHEMPAHHNLVEWIHAYIDAAGIGDQRKGWLFRSARGHAGRLSDKPLTQPDIYRMVGRYAKATGVATRIGCHSWRARGITAYLENGGALEHAQQMAGHASARTTKLYDRRGDEVSRDEVERISL